MNEAFRDDLIISDPFDHAEPMAKDYNPREIYMTQELAMLFPYEPEELFKLWGSAKIGVCMLVVATTGLRSGEVRALKWVNFKEDYQALEIMAAIKGNNKYNTETKSGENRAAYLPGRTFKIIQWWHTVTEFPDPQHFIFYGKNGSLHLYKKVLSDRLNKVLKALKITKGRRDVHSFRHTYAIPCLRKR